MLQLALNGKEKTCGREDTTVLDIVINLDNLYAIQGRLEETEQLYLRALDGYERFCGSEHPSTPATVYNLGKLYRDQDRLKDAEEMYQRALHGYAKAISPENLITYIPALQKNAGIRVSARKPRSGR